MLLFSCAEPSSRVSPFKWPRYDLAVLPQRKASNGSFNFGFLAGVQASKRSYGHSFCTLTIGYLYRRNGLLIALLDLFIRFISRYCSSYTRSGNTRSTQTITRTEAVAENKTEALKSGCRSDRRLSPLVVPSSLPW